MWILGSIVSLIVFALLWWNSPAAFLKSVNADDIAVIYVRDGQTGSRFAVRCREDITYIVENIQKVSFYRSGISWFKMGTWFTLSFRDENDRKISEFIVNADDTLRKDPFFFKTDAGNMDITDYLSTLEGDLCELTTE